MRVQRGIKTLGQIVFWEIFNKERNNNNIAKVTEKCRTEICEL